MPQCAVYKMLIIIMNVNSERTEPTNHCSCTHTHIQCLDKRFDQFSVRYKGINKQFIYLFIVSFLECAKIKIVQKRVSSHYHLAYIGT